MNPKEIADKIEEASGADILSLQQIKAYVWFPNNEGPTTFLVEGVCPLNPSLMVFAIFESDDAVRVYCLSTGTDPAKAEPPSCYTLDKRSPIFSRSVMNVQTFIHEVANEWSIVDTDSTTAANERDAVVVFLRNAPPGMFANAAAEAIEAGEHEETEDDDEVVTSVTTPAPSPSTAPAAKPS